ncbi:MAG: DUF2294 domain-containing protein [Anaerolineales bacterium]
MPQSTRGEVEASLANAVIQFEKEHLGRGPTEARAFIIEDMVLVRLRGVLTPAEMSLAQTAEGHSLIKQVRRQLLEGSRSLLEAIVQEKTGSQVKSLHTDISVRNGERVIVFTMAEDLEERFGWNKQERK